jgi:anti-anti-sigma regulatory factor
LGYAAPLLSNLLASARSSVSSALVNWSQTGASPGGTIKLLNLPPRVHDLLVITKLITLFDVFESEKDALSSFRQHADV